MTVQAEVLVDEGPPDDFAAYVGERSAALQRFAHLVTGGAADSADLVQDALERVHALTTDNCRPLFAAAPVQLFSGSRQIFNTCRA